jgi:hypothetical protein
MGTVVIHGYLVEQYTAVSVKQNHHVIMYQAKVNSSLTKFQALSI